jgi:pimeloyl-ACP methyl ester carboxylesterase
MSRPPVTNLVPPPGLAAKAGAEECRVDVDGIGIRYLRTGSGPPLLLVHGLMGSSFSWRKNMTALAKIATVYAPDLPGTGYSDRTPIDRSFAGIARLMLRFMEVLGIEHATVLGSSHGGAVVMSMADLDREPRRIDRMILVSPVNPYARAAQKRVAFFASPFVSFLVNLSAPVSWRLHRYFFARMYGDPRRITPGTVEGYGAPLAIRGTFPHILSMLKCWGDDVRALEEALQRIALVPALLIWGSRDTAVVPSSAEPLRRNFANARLIVMESAGHLPYEELPEEFNRILLEFLTTSLKP